MAAYVGCDAHRKFSVFVEVDENGRQSAPRRVEHDPEQMWKYLEQLPTGAEVALEASGGWYWLVDSMEKAGLCVHLADPLEAKKRMRGRNKTNALDALGLANLLREHRLPEVWIPGAELLDLRGLMRSRLSLRQRQNAVKCRINSALNRYGLKENRELREDLFVGKGRVELTVMIQRLPKATRLACQQEWDWIDEAQRHIVTLEDSLARLLSLDARAKRLMTLPGVGKILSAAILLEMGQAERFPSAGHFASYAGLVPRVYSSGDKTRHGSTPVGCNHYLKWAFVEAANCTVRLRHLYGGRHVGRLYAKIRGRANHGKAAVAVGRHLAESAWHMLKRNQDYREPAPPAVSSSATGSARG